MSVQMLPPELPPDWTCDICKRAGWVTGFVPNAWLNPGKASLGEFGYHISIEPHAATKLGGGKLLV